MIVLANYARELSLILTNFYQRSFHSGIFPVDWKVTRLKPLIEFLSIFFVFGDVVNYLQNYKLVDDQQLGFRHRFFVNHNWHTFFDFHVVLQDII